MAQREVTTFPSGEGAYSRMLIHRSTVGLVVEAPAKLNLFFEVLGKRRDGYHEIETLMMPIGLFDTLSFEEDLSGQITFECQNTRRESRPEDGTMVSKPGPETLPLDENNLVVRAVELFRHRAGVRRGARLRLTKRIPIAAGLGGGSSDAAAALTAANLGWSVGWSHSQLSCLAAELGSDVPFFFNNGSAVCRGRGEQIEPTATVGTMAFVVVRPPEGLSTATVYQHCQPASTPRKIEPMLKALEEGDWSVAGRQLFNRLQPVARELSVWIRKLEDTFNHEDCLGHIMSGSGTCYFALCRHMRHARRVARRLQATGIGTAYAVRASR